METASAPQPAELTGTISTLGVLPSDAAVRGDSARALASAPPRYQAGLLSLLFFRAGFYFYTGYGLGLSTTHSSHEELKLSGKSPQGSNDKKPGKSIKDKRAEKRAKNSTDAELIPKKRKGQ
ncbi:hypothetical protein J2M53_00205 [Arthrobacter sp. zg-ZUI100]|uniref:hypothetical protein n=1 Tax=Arthrobacter jiangjiafuii TaxID=2817475 RepID=UPI001AEE7F92|nr:hypothetical protein [Arthrobacter jiangjiafuii]MBP3034675.1 hypothetical protein [Arthrobacter jiangjiafuii]